VPDPGALQLETQNRRLPRWFWRLTQAPCKAKPALTGHLTQAPYGLRPEKRASASFKVS
jgi:hypothetical protein